MNGGPRPQEIVATNTSSRAAESGVAIQGIWVLPLWDTKAKVKYHAFATLAMTIQVGQYSSRQIHSKRHRELL